MRTDALLFLLVPQKMQKISKPDLVDFLRISDHRRWLCPRIRYASIRSKPELLADLRRHFQEKQVGHVLEFHPRNPRLHLPRIQYDLKKKTFLFDGLVVDVPKRSREKVQVTFRGPVTMTF